MTCLLAWLIFVSPAQASVGNARETPDICRAAAAYAAKATGTPLSVLMAISLTETGRKRKTGFAPWPWTVNMEGTGKWFETRKQAFDYAQKNFNRGARSFDVGCFQINYKWHGSAFDSIAEMFEPKANALYAGLYLAALYKEKGNWIDAAGAYHSRTPKYANKYKKRFARIHAQLPGAEDLASLAAPAPAIHPRKNTFPLLQMQADATTARGSLVPIGPTANAKGLLANPVARLF